MKVRYIIDIELEDNIGDDVWFGNELRHLAEEWGKLIDEDVGIIQEDNPTTTPQEELSRIHGPNCEACQQDKEEKKK